MINVQTSEEYKGWWMCSLPSPRRMQLMEFFICGLNTWKAWCQDILVYNMWGGRGWAYNLWCIGAHTICCIRTYCISSTCALLTMNGISELKGQCHEIFDFRLFSWISFPQALLLTFRIFSKILVHIRRSRCTTGVIDTSGKCKNLIMFRHLWLFVWLFDTGCNLPLAQQQICCQKRWHRWQICRQYQ